MKEHRHTTYWKHILKDFNIEPEDRLFLVFVFLAFAFIWYKWGWWWSVGAYFCLDAFGRFGD